MAKNLISGTTTTINENGNDISVDLNTDYKDIVDSVGSVGSLETTDKTSIVNAINELNENHKINDSSLLFDKSNRITFTPSGCSNYSGYGGCYYYKIGTRVYINVGVNGLTANTTTNVITLPEGYRPDHFVNSFGTGNSSSQYCCLQVQPTGVVGVRSQGQFAGAYAIFDAVQ